MRIRLLLVAVVMLGVCSITPSTAQAQGDPPPQEIAVSTRIVGGGAPPVVDYRIHCNNLTDYVDDSFSLGDGEAWSVVDMVDWGISLAEPGGCGLYDDSELDRVGFLIRLDGVIVDFFDGYEYAYATFDTEATDLEHTWDVQAWHATAPSDSCALVQEYVAPADAYLGLAAISASDPYTLADMLILTYGDTIEIAERSFFDFGLSDVSESVFVAQERARDLADVLGPVGFEYDQLLASQQADVDAWAGELSALLANRASDADAYCEAQAGPPPTEPTTTSTAPPPEPAPATPTQVPPDFTG